MEPFRYVIVGGGMAADAAVEGIRGVDEDGSILVLSADADPPYSRPPLSKGLWKGDDPESVWRGTAEKGADVRTGVRVTRVDPVAKEVEDAAGATYAYDALLLTTGGQPRRLPFGADDVIYFRTLDTYRRLRELADAGERFAVVGGGFIGSEIAAALALNGKRVTEIFPGPGIGASAYPLDVSRHLNDYYRERDVDVVAEERVVGLERRGEALVLSTEGGRELEVDGVVAGIGIVPDTELAQAAGIETDDGIVVDELLRTSAPGVFAAGDVASFPSAAFGRLLRVEHEDNALTMGRHAGRNLALGLAGEELEPYAHLPFFYTDMFDLGYEAVGDLDASLEVVADWREPYREGVLYYLDRGRVRGVLLWNVWGKVDEARGLVGQSLTPEELRGQI